MVSRSFPKVIAERSKREPSVATSSHPRLSDCRHVGTAPASRPRWVRAALARHVVTLPYQPANPHRFTGQELNPSTLYNGQLPSTPVSRGTMPM